MNPVLAFDIYGTLIDTHGVVEELQSRIGDSAWDFSRRWREKQLEYTFRRGLMKNYVDFPTCTRQALDYCDKEMQTGLNDEDKTILMQRYTSLPAFDEVPSVLATLQQAGMELYAFSNGTVVGVNGLLEQAGIRGHFIDIISVDEIGSYKPDPSVYEHCLQRIGAQAGSCWLVSSNPFDILGADNVGMLTAWVQRDPGMVFDPWDIRPTSTISCLSELPDILRK
jgi:2-haloacid dehalogenase